MRRLYALLTLAILAVALVFPTTLATADSGHTLTVDGTVYTPTKVVGNAADHVVHYETPDTDPTAAFSERHQWVGNGSEHLPCPFGIHWIDNKNVLTISNCLGGETSTTLLTTTTTMPTSSTTITTVTTVPSSTTSTTSTVPTTSTSTTSTTSPVTSSTSVPQTTPTTLPKTGLPSGSTGLLAGVLIGLGYLTLALTRKATT